MAILAVAASLRYINLDVNPGWEADEGYNLNIAWNLLESRRQMFATTYAFVQHPPLFYIILMPLFKVFGATIVTLRFVAATYGVLTVPLLYFIGRTIAGRSLGLLAAALFAIYPLAITANRLGYTYNQLMFLSALAFLATLKYLSYGQAESSQRHRWLFAAGIATALALATDQEAIYLLLFGVAISSTVRWRDAAQFALLSLSLPVFEALLMLGLDPAAFLLDFKQTWLRVGGDGLMAQVMALAANYLSWLTLDAWIPLGLAGLFLLKNPRTRLTTVAVVFMMLAVILKIRDVNPFFRTAIPVLPFVCLGLAILLQRAIDYLFSWLVPIFNNHLPQRAQAYSGVLTALIVFSVGLSPLPVTLIDDIQRTRLGFKTGFDSLLVTSIGDAQAVASYINAQTTEDTTVIAWPQIAWQMKARTLELPQAVASTGESAAFYPAGMPASRFAYDANYQAATFIVVDNFTRRWVAEMPREADIIADVRQAWPLVFAAGEYAVYANPTVYPRSGDCSHIRPNTTIGIVRESAAYAHE